MKSAALCQQLNREIIFVAGKAFNCLAIRKSSDHRSIAGIEIAVGKYDCGTNCFGGPAARKSAEVGCKESTMTANHMTAGAYAFAEKKYDSHESLVKMLRGK